MIIDYKREKLLNAILFFSKNIKELTLTKLMKLLSQLDYRHFKETGDSVTGLKYYTYPKGDFSETLNNEVNNKNRELLEYVDIIKKKKGRYDATVFYPKKELENKYFSKRELKILNDLIETYKHSNAKEMSKISHEENTPWSKTMKEKGMYKEIDMFLTIEDRDFEEYVRESIEDRKVIEDFFNGF